MDLISSQAIDVVSKALDGHSQRHKAIVSNIANVDTPGYHRRMVSFEDSLQEAILAENQKKLPGSVPTANNKKPLPLITTDPSHFSPVHPINSIADVTPQMNEAEGWEYRSDGNSVDIETEMSQLAKNSHEFSALAEMQKRMVQGLNSVISGSAQGG